MSGDLADETAAIRARGKPRTPKRRPAAPVGPSLRDEAAARRAAAAARRAAALAAARRAAEQARLAAVRKRAAELAKNQRELAYENLLARSRSLYRRLDAPVDKRGFATTVGGFKPPIEDRTIASETRARAAYVRAKGSPARAAAELKRLRAEQVRTGGRYVDSDSYDAVMERVRSDSQAAEDALIAKIKDAERLLKKWKKSGDREDAKAVIALTKSAEYEAAVKAYIAWFGKGRKGKGGAVRGLVGQASQIARTKDAYITRQIENFYRPPLDPLTARNEERLRTTLQRSDFGDPRLGTARREGTGSQRMTMQEYLDSVAKQDQERMREARTRFGERKKIWEFEGYDVKTDGRTSLAKNSPEGRSLNWIGKGLAKGVKLSDLIDSSGRVKGATRVDQQRNLMALMEAGMAGWAADQAKLTDPRAAAAAAAAGSYIHTGAGAEAGAARAKEKTAAWNQLWAALTGGQSDRASAFMLQAAGAPGIGELMKGMQIPIGLVGTLANFSQNALGGRLTTPDIQFDALLGSGKDLASFKGADGKEPLMIPGVPGVGWDMSAARKKMNDEEFKQFVYEFYVAAAGDPIKQMEIAASYGAEPIQGSLGQGAFNIFGDPLLAVSLTKFLGGGRLAAGRLGGISGALGNPKSFARDWWKMSAPEFKMPLLRGLGGEAGLLTERKILAGLEKAMGRQLPDQAAVVAARQEIELLLNATTKEETTALAKKILGAEAGERETRQLISFVEDLSSKEAVALGILPASANKVAALGKQLETALLRSQGEAALSAARVARIAEEESARLALAPTLEAKAVASGTFSAVPPAPRPVATINKHVDRIRKAGEVQLRNITEARDAFAKAEAITDPARARERVALVMEAKQKYQDWARMRERTTGHVGPVVRAIEQFRDFDRTISGGRSFERLASDITTRDVAFSRLKMIRAKKAGNAGEFAKWEAAYKAGAKVLRREKDHATRVDALVHAKAAESAEYVRRSDIAVRVDSPEEATEHFLREAYARVHPDGEEASVGRSFEAPKAGDEAIQQGIENLVPSGVIWDAAALDPSLIPLYRSILPLLDGRDMRKVWAALTYLRDYEARWGDDWLDDLLEDVWKQIQKGHPDGSLRGVTADQGMRAWRRVTADAADNFTGMDLTGFRNLDKIHADAISAARGGRAQGVAAVRRTTRRGTGVAPVPSRRDTQALEVLARLDAQDGTVLHDMPLEVWDQARGLLGRNERIRVNSVDALAKAQGQAAKTGRALGEVHEEGLEALRLREGGVALRKFASTMVGSSDDEIWAAYQLAQFGEVTTPGLRQVTPFQRHLFNAAFIETTGAGPVPWMRARYFGGEAVPSYRQTWGPARHGAPPEPGAPAGARSRNPIPIADLADEPDLAGLPFFYVDDVIPGNELASGVHQVPDGVQVVNRGLHTPERYHETVFHEAFHGLSKANDVAAWLGAMADRADNAFGGLLTIIPQYRKNYVEWVNYFRNQGLAPAAADAAALTHVFEEVAGTLYAYRRLMLRGEDLPPNSFFVIPGATAAAPGSFGEWLSMMSADQRALVGEMFEYFRTLDGRAPDPKVYGLSGLMDPPVGNARLFREWMVARGYWSPRDARLIAEGQVSWSVDAERQWLKSRGYRVPERLDEALLRKAVRSPDLYDEFMRASGVFGDDLDNAVALRRIEPGKEGQVAVAFGLGTKKARTLEQLRRYAAERYGALVARVDAEGKLVMGPDGPILHDMPWLMTVDEYTANVGRFVAEGLPPGVVAPERLDAFTRAAQKAVKHRMAAWEAKGILERGELWLPEEAQVFALGIVDELLASGDWMGMFGKGSRRRRAINVLGFVQRLNIVTNLAFPVMNLLDAYGPKRFLLALQYRDFRMLPMLGGFDADALDAVRSLGDVSRRPGGVFDLAEKGPAGLIRDPEVRMSVKVRAAFHLLPNWGFELSSVGEDHLRLMFARRIYMAERDDLIARGWDVASARTMARFGSAMEIQKIFPSLEDAGDFEKALNQIVPFFSYNARNKVLGIKMVAANPYILSLAERVGAAIETSNRATWEAQGNDPAEFPEDKARQFWFEVDGTRYTVDLSTFSDWFRGPAEVLGNGTTTWPEFFGGFIRLVHPQQVAYLAWIANALDGGSRETPWGTVANASMLWPVDLVESWSGVATGEKTAIEALAKSFFFARVGRLTPTDGRLAFWKHLMDQGKRDEANAYLDDHPDVRTWLELHRRDGYRLDLDGFSASWFGQHTDEERRALIAARDGVSEIGRKWDERMAPYVDTPWDPALKEMKKQRRAEMAIWYRTHPELADARAWGMDAYEWSSQLADWVTDDDFDAWFAMLDTKPQLGQFKNERAYLVALGQFQDLTAAWLEAHPAVVARLRGEEGTVTAAWYDQQARWEKILRDQTRLRIEALDLDGSESKRDRKILDAVYGIIDSNYLLLDREAFTHRDTTPEFAGDTTSSQGRFARLAGGVGLAGKNVSIPGSSDYWYNRSSPAEQAETRDREAYFERLDRIMDRAVDKNGKFDVAKFGRILDRNPEFAEKYYAANPKAARGHAYYLAIKAVYNNAPKYGFYRELEKDPALMAEYFRRNPEKLEKYRMYKRGVAYFEGISRIYAQSKSAREFWTNLEAHPKLYREYLARNPDKAAAIRASDRFYAQSKAYVDLVAAGKFEEAQEVWSKMSQEARARFYKAVGGTGSGGWVANSQYYSSMGHWAGLLKAGKYDEARRYFAALPNWVKEKYVARHPDKATMLLSSREMGQAGDYFLLPTAKDREAFLRRHPGLAQWFRRFGGESELRRGAIQVAYSNLPNDPWLKRVFRERYPEIFSEEAQIERANERTARRLAEHPELAPAFRAFVERIEHEMGSRLGQAPPEPFTTDRVRASLRRKRARSRSARWTSEHSRHTS